MRKKKIVSFPRFCLLCGELVVLFGIGYFVPVRLDVVQVAPIYAYQTCSRTDFRGTVHTLFGRTMDVTEKLSVTLSEDGTTLDVSYRNLAKQYSLDPIDVAEVHAEYQGALYVNQPPKEDQVRVEAVYEDGRSVSVSGNMSLPDRATEDTVVPVQTKMGNIQLQLEPIQVEQVTAEYTQATYPGDTFSRDYVKVTVVFENGVSQVVQNFTCDVLDPLITGSMEIPISCAYGTTTLVLEPMEITSIRAAYDGSVYEGAKMDRSNIHVWLQFANGSERELYAYQYDRTQVVMAEEEMNVPISTEFGSTTLEVDVVGVTSVEMQSETSRMYEGSVIDPDGFVLHYEDGTSLTLSAKEVSDTDSWNVPVVQGENVYQFTYQGITYDFTVIGREPTRVSRAAETLQQEIADSVQHYISDDIFVTIRKYRYHEASYYLTHVIINSPSQIHAGLSYDDYGGERETPTHAAARLDWVVGVNGSNFSYATGGADTNMATAIIKNGEKMADSGNTANGREICLKADGTLCASRSGASVEALLAAGVTDTFSCGDTELIVAGNQVNLGIQSEQYRYPRTAIGMVEPGEYYLITAGSGSYEGGMTYDEVREILWDHGCVFGKCMDGGGSSALVFDGTLVNPPATGTERPVSDFLYFTDLDESELDTAVFYDDLADGSVNTDDIVIDSDDSIVISDNLEITGEE